MSGFRCWSAAVINTDADMSVHPRSKAFLGVKITKDFHFSPTQKLRDDINSMLFYPSVITQGSVLYFMGYLVAGDILSSSFSTYYLIYD